MLSPSTVSLSNTGTWYTGSVIKSCSVLFCNVVETRGCQCWKSTQMVPFSSGESLPFASERPDMTVLAKETTARLAASFKVRIFPHGGASASVSIMKRTDGPKHFSKLHIFTQINPLCREIFSCCGKIVFTDVSLSRTHLLSPCTNSFLPRRQSFPKTFQRTPSQRQAHQLPETSASGS